MSDHALRSGLIRLAHAKPELRPVLLPLLTDTKAAKTAGTLRYEGDTALDKVYAMTDLLIEAKRGLDPQTAKSPEVKAVQSALYALEKVVQKAGGAGKKASVSIPVTLKREVKLKDGTVLPKGAQGSLRFNANAPRVVTVDFDTRPNTNLGVAGLYENFGRPFMKVPSMSSLSRMADGLSKSVTGKTVEPDGYGPDGSPSWLLVLGMI